MTSPTPARHARARILGRQRRRVVDPTHQEEGGDAAGRRRRRIVHPASHLRRPGTHANVNPARLARQTHRATKRNQRDDTGTAAGRRSESVDDGPRREVRHDPARVHRTTRRVRRRRGEGRVAMVPLRTASGRRRLARAVH